MRFTKTFNKTTIDSHIKDIYETVIYTWSEYDPVVCDPKDGEELKKLGESLVNSLEEVLTTLEKMGKINKDSFEC